MAYLRPPYLKGKGFSPNPIAKNGIPPYADSSRNRKVIGTPDHQKYWEEQLHYIFHGYDTGGMWIPGRVYYFWNFRILPTIMGPIRPDICDLHLELGFKIEDVKSPQRRRNLLVPKARRKGISEFTHAAVIDYGWRFFYDYKGGIAAGNSDYIDDFLDKWRYADARIVNEFKIKVDLGDAKDEIVAGYEERDEENSLVEAGTRNTIYGRTMQQNPALFEGLYLNDVIAEEAGKFPKIKSFDTSVNECTMHGDIRFGTKFYYGTGGNMGKESKEFKEIRYNAEALDFDVFTIYGYRFYFPFFAGCAPQKGIGENIPNLQKLEPEQRLGIEDTEAAKEAILKRRKKLLESGDLKEYRKFCQAVPLDEKEIFANTTSNDFDPEKLNDKLLEIDTTGKKFTKYKGKWKTNPKGEFIRPLQVEMIAVDDTVDEEECILIYRHPRPNSSNLCCAGVDSYDKDQSKTSKSLGAMVVLSRDHGFTDYPRNTPLAMIRCRPKRKEKFYEMCMMLSVYYDLRRATLIDVEKGVIIEHYKNWGLSQYLAKRPVKFESENSDQVHEFGFNLNSHSRPRMTSLMQTYVYDHADKIEFPILIEELQGFDEYAVDSDNDAADGLGIALVQDKSMRVMPSEEKPSEAEDEDAEEWVEDGDGDMVLRKKAKSLLNYQQDHESFGKQ